MTQHLLLFDLEVYGHHPGYIRHLLHYWADARTHLHLVVSPELQKHHQDVVQAARRAQITWWPITNREARQYEASKRSLVRWAWQEWQLFYRYAAKLQPTHGLIMYIDRFQLPLSLRLRLPCPTSGIFFRPKFHYPQLHKHHSTIYERRQAVRERCLWGSALRHRQLKTLFLLDPFAVKPLRLLSKQTNIVHVADPVEIYSQPPVGAITLRQTLGIEPTRTVLLLFGMIDRRKGLYQLLDALHQLPASQQKQITLLLVGPLEKAEEAAGRAAMDKLRCQTAVQLVVHHKFIPDEQIQPYFELADVVLAPYQYHIGMSAILIRAAAAGKPVLASDYGLMGELVHHHRLGSVVDSTQPAAIAQGLATFLARSPHAMIDLQKAAQFAHENQAVHFAQTIGDHLR